MGSVFSPYYARARTRGAGEALDHCALNVALYGPRARRWALTERGRRAVRRSGSALAIGPSAIGWEGDTLVVRIDETTFPLPSRLKGVVKIHPAAISGHSVALDVAGRHRWSPLAACARVEVALTHPDLRWSGAGYLDTNSGDEPLDRAFARWHWSRARVRDGTVILYDIDRREGGDLALALACDATGRVRPLPLPAGAPLPRTSWGIERHTLADAGHVPGVVASFENTPFYARSLISTRLYGEPALAVHESLSLDRFRRAWVRALLPFRMPRVRW